MRQQGRTKAAKANNLHHMQRENIHTVRRPASRMRCPEEPSQTKGYMNYPAFSLPPLCCLSMFIVQDELAPFSHHIQSFSLHHPPVSLLHPLLLPFLSCPLPKRTPCASIACMMDSRERASIDLSSEEAGAERKHREKLQEAPQIYTHST